MNFSTFTTNSTTSQNNNNNNLSNSEAVTNDTILSTSNILSSTTPSYIPSWFGQSNININNSNNFNISSSEFQYTNGHTINHYNNHCNGNINNRNRYAPYQNRSYSTGSININYNQSLQPLLNQTFSSVESQNNYITPATYNNFNKILTESTNFYNNNNINNNNGYKKINMLNNGNNNNLLLKNFQSCNTTLSSSSSSMSTSNHSQFNNLISSTYNDLNNVSNNVVNSINNNNNDPNQPITLQINNLDYSFEEQQLRGFLLNQLKPITPVISLIFEGSSCAKVTVPDLYYAKQVVSNLHRKKIGHKRIVVSYTRDSSTTEISTLRCQVAGLLKDVPYCTLPMYKFRELFQSRFKTSISVLDLYKMQDICNIATDNNDDKHISLNTELINSIENNPLMEGLQESVPYCSIHFQKEQHKGWAEQEIEPLPNIFMTISEMRQIICPLLKSHSGDIPVASLIYCIAGELGIQINRNENGVNLEHLICCINGVQISVNNFGIKVLGWLVPENVIGKENGDRFIKTNCPGDPLYQISKEVIELIKMSPKSTMKFNRFIPAYHNHFGKQCRVADYGYTKLIELFEALSSVVQIMGDGENRQITLTHRIQIRRFTTDLLRIIRSQGNKSILLSQLPEIFFQTQNRIFDITDYGVCAIEDILDGLANSNIIVITPIQNGNDILISIPKRKQTIVEIEKTCVFAGEVVELLCNAPQYSILFQKFVRSYHYHFGYQCRLSDYGFLKLADLMEAIQGVVEIELTNDEDKKIFLSPKVARRVFAEQLEELVKVNTGTPNTCMKLDEVLLFHKKKYGYQIQSQTLGFANIFDAIRELPYIEIIEVDGQLWIVCHLNDANFRDQTYRICRLILNSESNIISLNELLNMHYANYNETIQENSLLAMKYAIEIQMDKGTNLVVLTRLMRYIMKVVKVINQYKTLTLGEIKKYLSITLGDCFKIGYPNITTFIRAYPDIFNFELNSLVDRSKISLVSTCALLTSCPTINSSSGQTFTSQNIPLLKEKVLSVNIYNNDMNNNTNNDNIICMKNVFENENENKFSNYINSQKFISIEDKNKFTSEFSLDDIELKYALNYEDQYHHKRQFLQLQSDQQQSTVMQRLYGKDNSFNVSLNSSNASMDLNSTATLNTNLNKNVNSLSLSNGSANSVTSSCDGMNFSAEVNSTDINNNDPFTDFPKLWTNGSIDYFNDNLNYSKNDDIFGLLKTTKTNKNIEKNSELNNNKENTDNSEVLSFWVDPIWGNDNKHSDLSHDQKNSTIDNTTKFDILELQPYNVIHPTMENPYQLSKTENMKQNMFSLDSSDEKLS